jgi:carboxymethylenebutenolidase
MQNTHLGNLYSILVILIVFVVFVPNLIHDQVNATTTITTDDPLTINGVNNNLLENLTKSSSSSSSSFPIENENVSYYNNTLGYLTYPIIQNDTKNFENRKLPGIVMIHEWWGLNENIKNMAESLAKEGYVVLAVDLYDGKVANTTDAAQNLVSKVRENPSESINNLQHAVRYLASLENVNSSQISSLGWCFGGGQSLQLALNTEPEYPLAATIIYYGNLVSDQESISKIKWPVLGVFGDQDKSISVESVKQFEKALNANGITNEIYIYEGVGHAFANPSGDNYAPQETQDAWEKTVSFLKKYLG